jgi:hypothetical protein
MHLLLQSAAIPLITLALLPLLNPTINAMSHPIIYPLILAMIHPNHHL